MTTLIERHNDRYVGGLALETRAKYPIPNGLIPEDDAPEVLASWDKIMCETYPRIRLLCSSALYNCGGLVFGARRVWIEPDQFRKILNDDGYKPVQDSPQPGDIVLYGLPESVNHVGVVHHTDLASLPERPEPLVWVRSKWGWCGEYVHEIQDVPEQFGKPLEILRFR